MLAYAFIDKFVYGMSCDCESYNILYMNLRSGIILSYWSGRVGLGWVRSGHVRSCQGRSGQVRYYTFLLVRSGRVGSDWVGSGQVMSGHVRAGQVRSGIILSYWSGRVGSGRIGLGQVRSCQGRSGQVRYYTFFPHYYLITTF